MKKTIYAALLAALLFTVPASLSSAQNAEITVERSESKIYSGFKERVYIDGKSRLTLVNGASGKITIPAGEHTIHAELYTLKTEKLTFNARSGVRFVVTPHSMDSFVIEQQGGSGIRPAGAAAFDAPDFFDGPPDNSVEGILLRAAGILMNKIPPNSRIAIVYVTAKDAEVSEFIAGELEIIMLDKGCTLIDRSELDRIRKEQQLQMSGEVDDNLAVSIGKFAGANTIITGAVTGSGDLRRLRLRALSTESGQVLAAASEKY
ncbi:MAG: CsgG/HfaB family protein [Spirochaetaceae bacterium]|nr:CsgG/HfaB family protein [Spirochaetaceae bacterium]